MNPLSQDQLSAMNSAGNGVQPQQAPTGALSKDQLDAMMGMGLQPNQAAAVSGHATGLLGNILGGLGSAYNAYANTAGNIATGVAKGEVSTLQNIGNVIAKPVAGAIDKATLPTGQTPQPVGLDQPTLTPQGAGEQVGYTGEKVGEFFAPAGAEKAAIAKGAEYIDQLPQAIGVTGKIASTITGALKTALQGLVGATSMGGVTAAQTGDINKAENAATFGGVAGGLGGALETFAPGIIQSLNKADFRLSPAAEAKTSKIANSAAQFITDNGIMGSSATKYEKLNSLNSQLENTLQSSLPEEIAVPKQSVIDNINSTLDSLRSSDPAIYNQARTKADEAINLLKSQAGDTAFTKGGTISLKDALAGKRSWGSLAFKTSQASKRDPLVSSEGAFAVEQGYQKALEDTMQNTDTPIKVSQQLASYFGGKTDVTLSDFNKVYSNAINAKNLSFMSQFKNDAGLFGRLFGLWVGKSVGHAISPGLGGEIAGGAAGEVLSTHLPGMARNMLERGLSHPQAPETAAKLFQATQNNP